jgi:hypothetical protein
MNAEGMATIIEERKPHDKEKAWSRSATSYNFFHLLLLS